VPVSRALPLAAMAFLAQGCFSARYVAQAAGGQLAILAAARPLGEAIADPATPDQARRLLGAVRSIKEWGEAQGLRPTRNYQRYADLRRPAAVWVVQACAPLAFEPRRWSFPVVGTIPYLGYFDEGAAHRQADELARREGLDVDVRTAGAFSTLGWFRDPVVSTMLGGGEAAAGDLADVVLHESVHATVYVNDQSTFDESLASFVADRLTPPWLERTFGPGSAEARAWAEARARSRQRLARLHRAYQELDALYRSADPALAKLARKAELLGALQRDLGLARPLNNAALAGFRTYGAGEPAFERLLATAGGSWRAFLGAVKTLSPGDFARPQEEDFEEVLDRLAARLEHRAGATADATGRADEAARGDHG
jgi:predicted aminopeptidase